MSTPATSLLPASPAYLVQGQLAQGGMGVVWRAYDLRLNRLVAIKTVQEHYRHSAAAYARFVAEAQIIGQLQHPGIPAVHELGTLPDGHLLAAAGEDEHHVGSVQLWRGLSAQ